MIFSENRFPLFRIMLLFEHDLYRKTGSHFSGSCSVHKIIQHQVSLAARLVDQVPLHRRDRVLRRAAAVDENAGQAVLETRGYPAVWLS